MPSGRPFRQIPVEELGKLQHEHLNKEILENSNKVYQVLNFCISGTGALLVLALKLDFQSAPFGPAFQPFAPLLPLAIIVPAMMLIESSLHATARIATYLLVTEEQTTPKVERTLSNEQGGSGERKSALWQSAMQWWRRQERQRRQHTRKSIPSLCALFRILIYVCFALSLASLTSTVRWACWPHAKGDTWKLWAVVLLVTFWALTVLLIWSYCYKTMKGLAWVFSSYHFDNFESTWRSYMFGESCKLKRRKEHRFLKRVKNALRFNVNYTQDDIEDHDDVESAKHVSTHGEELHRIRG